MSENTKENIGEIKISDDVIATYVAQITMGIEGVYELSAGFTENLSKSLLRIDSQPKGIKISHEDEDIIIDIYIVVEFKVNIPQLSWEIQKQVRDDVKEFTGQNIREVNIHVQGVNISGEDKKEI